VREDLRFWIADCSRISVSSDLDKAQELTLDQLIDRNVQALGENRTPRRFSVEWS